MKHDNFFSISPVLDGKMLDINVTKLFSGDTVVDHIDGRHSVFVKWGEAIFGGSLIQ